jgi:predicted GNAT superfamily acetyltransferase
VSYFILYETNHHRLGPGDRARLDGFAAANDLVDKCKHRCDAREELTRPGGILIGAIEKETAMVRVTVLYPNEPAKRFDHDYYARKHMPMVMERLKDSGMIRCEVDKGLAAF